jgi:hypothetical protein
LFEAYCKGIISDLQTLFVTGFAGFFAGPQSFREWFRDALRLTGRGCFSIVTGNRDRERWNMTTRDELVRAVLDASEEQDGRKRIECARALALAKKHGVKPRDIGDICNDQDVKIVNCQLGCFGEKRNTN